MAVVLMGAIAGKGQIEATFRFEAFGETHTDTKRDKWNQVAVDSAARLIAAVDALTPELDDVMQVQVYTPITDPAGCANAVPGECLDVTFRNGRTVRVGQATAVPDALAKARDAFKAAVVMSIEETL